MDERPVFDGINFVARDMPAMLEFYRLLGLEIVDSGPEWNAHHVNAVTTNGIDVDFDSQAFAQVWNQGWPADATGAVFGFRVVERAAVDATFERLTSAGYVGQQPPYDAFWGARYAVVADPDGNSVGIMSASDPARRTPGPPAPPA